MATTSLSPLEKSPDISSGFTSSAPNLFVPKLLPLGDRNVDLRQVGSGGKGFEQLPKFGAPCYNNTFRCLRALCALPAGDWSQEVSESCADKPPQVCQGAVRVDEASIAVPR